MIKNIIFDLGGVLVDLHGQRCIDAFMAIGAPEIAEYVRDCRTEDLFADIETGRMSTAEFCREVRRMSGCTASDADIISAWNSLLGDIPDEKKHLLLQLRASGKRVFLLSNTNEMHWMMCRDHLFPMNGKGVYDYFEHVFLSYEMGKIKPHEDIYAEVLQSAGIIAEETLFIDDNSNNLLGAEALGIKTFHECDGHHWTEHLRPVEATIGFFDGVHLGHQYLIRKMQEDASAHGLSTLVVSFRQHPRNVLQGKEVLQLLSSAEEKETLLRSMGVDNVLMLDFTRETAGMSARDFMLLLHDEYAVTRLFIGYDNRFGHNRNEGFDDYVRYGKQLGIEVIGNDALIVDGASVSSSRIRQLFAEGNNELAIILLGR